MEQSSLKASEMWDFYECAYEKGYLTALREVRKDIVSMPTGNPDYTNGVMNCLNYIDHYIELHKRATDKKEIRNEKVYKSD